MILHFNLMIQFNDRTGLGKVDSVYKMATDILSFDRE